MLKTESAREAIVFGLRLVRGIKLSEFQDRFGVNLFDRYGGVVAKLSRSGLLVVEKDTIRIPEDKLLVSNQVLNHFV